MYGGLNFLHNDKETLRRYPFLSAENICNRLFGIYKKTNTERNSSTRRDTPVEWSPDVNTSIRFAKSTRLY